MSAMARSLVLLIGLASCAGPTSTLDGSMYPRPSATGKGMLHLYCAYTAPYCGGADPGPEGMPRPQPWRGPMYLRPALPDSSGRFAINDLNIPIFDTIRTDGDGHGYLELLTGTYLLLEQDRVDDRRYLQLLRENAKATMHTEPIDTACMRQWLRGPFGVISIMGGDTLHVELPMHGRCPWYDTPCVSYFGPLPP